LAEKKQKIDDIRAEIARLNDQIKDINDEWFITSDHGSKSYTDETILPSPNKL
jgi:cell division protein FtsB